jgi:hypothetical protein
MWISESNVFTNYWIDFLRRTAFLRYLCWALETACSRPKDVAHALPSPRCLSFRRRNKFPNGAKTSIEKTRHDVCNTTPTVRCWHNNPNRAKTNFLDVIRQDSSKWQSKLSRCLHNVPKRVKTIIGMPCDTTLTDWVWCERPNACGPDADKCFRIKGGTQWRLPTRCWQFYTERLGVNSRDVDTKCRTSRWQASGFHDRRQTSWYQESQRVLCQRRHKIPNKTRLALWHHMMRR